MRKGAVIFAAGLALVLAARVGPAYAALVARGWRPQFLPGMMEFAVGHYGVSDNAAEREPYTRMLKERHLAGPRSSRLEILGRSSPTADYELWKKTIFPFTSLATPWLTKSIATRPVG